MFINRRKVSVVVRWIIIIICFLSGSCSIMSNKSISQDNACSILKAKRSWERAVSRTEKKWGISPGMQLSFIMTESNFRPRAKTSKTYLWGVFPTGRLSSAFGYAQAIDSTWDRYKKSSGNRFSSRTSFADSVDFIGWYVIESKRKVGLPKTDVFNQYLSYHQGHRGFLSGAYKNKPNLLKAARRTATNAKKFDSQLTKCR